MGSKGPRPVAGRIAAHAQTQTQTQTAPGGQGRDQYETWATSLCGISPDRLQDPGAPVSTGRDAVSGEIQKWMDHYFSEAALGADTFAQTVGLAALEPSSAEEVATSAARNLLDASTSGAAAALLGGLPGIAAAAAVKTGLDAAWSQFAPPRSTQAAQAIALFAIDFKSTLLAARRSFVTAATTCINVLAGDDDEQLASLLSVQAALEGAVTRVDPRRATAAALAGSWHRVRQQVSKKESFFPALVDAPRVEVLAYWDPANDRVVVRDVKVPGADPATLELIREARVGECQLPRRVTLGNTDLAWDARDGAITSVTSSPHADRWLSDLATKQRGPRWETAAETSRVGLIELDRRVAMETLQ